MHHLLLLAFTFLLAQAQGRGDDGCTPDPEFGESCPTHCGVADVMSNFHTHVREGATNAEEDLTKLEEQREKLEININTIREDSKHVTTKTQDLRSKGYGTIENILEQVKILESVSISHDNQIKELVELYKTNRDQSEMLKANLVSIVGTCKRSCVDKTEESISPITGKDCQQIADNGGTQSGLYNVKPLKAKSPFLVYCEIDRGVGWTVIQHRQDGSVNFSRGWNAYREGFGYLSPTLNSEFWLGNEKMHLLTTQDQYRLRVELTDWDGEKRYADYGHIKIGSEDDSYRLFYSVFLEGDAGDSFDGFDFGDDPSDKQFTSHLGMQFSTRDSDNDRYDGNCAAQDGSGWWMNRCHAAHLNGQYYPGGLYTRDEEAGTYDNGIIWSTWHDRWYSLKSTSMKLLPMVRQLGAGQKRGDY
uniref:fibrinogen gamma chain n=1 Tax=Myxine glutinosa TaxID=7769 RepID=UPI00358EA36E